MGREESEVSLWIKYTIFAFNFIFWIIGCVLFGVGLYAEFNKGWENIKETFSTDPAIILLIVGALIFIIGFCGCLGALRENKILLQIFVWSIAVIFLLEIITAVLAFVFRNELTSAVEKYVNNAIERYRRDSDLRNVIDSIQEYFECCGGVDQNDWDLNEYFNCSSPSPEACGVPSSCCMTKDERINSQCGYDVRRLKANNELDNAHVWSRGCFDAIVEWAKTNLILIASIALSIAVLQIFAIGCGCSLVNSIKRQEEAYY
ncbi:tetraspanin-33-like [Oscarella lobularis]|uniref:tetraspanin-33-like n=1 Tax=Oscarella lobularis TaxID=121494 RepID=UPI0033137B31